MNDEIGNFLIKFTTEGFDKVDKQLTDLNKNMDKLGDSLSKSEKKGESFFGALLKWDIGLGAITKSFNLLKETIGGVFDTAKDMNTLFRSEQTLGVEAKVLERWGLVAEAFDGSRQDAYSFFGNVNKLMQKASTPDEWSSEDQKSLAKAGIAWAYDFGMTDVQNRDAYLVALRNAFIDANNDPKHKQSLKERLRKYVSEDSYFALFDADEKTFMKSMDWADQWRVLSKHPDKLDATQQLKLTQIEWGQIKKEFEIMLADPLNTILKALEPLKDPLLNMAKRLGDWAEENADNMAKWVEDGVNWIITEGPNILRRIGDVCKAIGDLAVFLAPVVSWAVKNIGGSLDFLGDIGKWISGEMSWDDINSKYEKEGGGIFGWGLRGGNRLGELLTAPTSSQIEWARNYNTTNNYGGNVTVEAGWHPTRQVINPNRISGATLSTLRK